jgi:hypothetical protein
VHVVVRTLQLRALDQLVISRGCLAVLVLVWPKKWQSCPKSGVCLLLVGGQAATPLHAGGCLLADGKSCLARLSVTHL